MLCNGRFFWKNIESIPKTFTSVRHCSAVKQSEIGVTIPRRIERGPTDVLKALASTVQRDPTAFPYKYPDDPHFYPFSNSEKRIYALSLESGRKSAKWIIKNNPGFFKNQLSEPPIEAFLPKKVYDENSEVTEEILVGVIEKRNVLDAIAVYELLLMKGTVISSNVKQSLLELVCFYNCEERAIEEELECKWFANVEQSKVEVNTWKEQSFAETLFESMDPNCPLANSTIIQGMVKHNNIQKAFEIFNRAKSNNVKFSVGVYNGLLSQASNTSIDIANGWNFIQTLLQEMSEEKINPNLATLNAALYSMMHLQGRQRNDDNVKKLVIEFAHLGILPSLGTYYYLFRIFGNTRRVAERNKELFFKMLDIIQNVKHEMRHPSDLLFFPHVMNLFSAVCNDVDLVNRLNDILFQDDNIKFLGSSFSESMYFRSYLLTLFKKEPVDIAMEKYRELVPTFYTPEYDILSAVLSAVIANGAYEYLTEFWEDLIKFKMSKFFRLWSSILPLAKFVTDEAVLKVIYEASACGLEYFEEFGFQKANQETTSNLIIAFLKTGGDEKALELFTKIKDFRSTNALLNAEAIGEVFDWALDKKNVKIIMDCLRYASDEFHSNFSEMAEAALPLLSKSEQTWANQLISKAKEMDDELEESPPTSPPPSPPPSPSQ